jgi:hypothetical protein
MSNLQQLRDAQTLADIARILRYRPRSLSYVLYRLPNAQKYSCFEIPKRSGGVRKILAPCPQLKLAQRKLADLLYSCLKELKKEGNQPRTLSHGLEPTHSIVTHATLHKSRRYVLNLDLEAFFPTENYGRER